MLRNHPEIKGFMWLYEAALPMWKLFSIASPFRGKSYNAQAKQVPDDQRLSLRNFYADVFPVGTAGIPPTLLMQDMLPSCRNIWWITTSNTAGAKMTC